MSACRNRMTPVDPTAPITPVEARPEHARHRSAQPPLHLMEGSLSGAGIRNFDRFAHHPVLGARSASSTPRRASRSFSTCHFGMVHVPLGVSRRFAAGERARALRRRDGDRLVGSGARHAARLLENDTVVIFTSDNGPG